MSAIKNTITKQYVVEFSAEEWGEHREWHEEVFFTQDDADAQALVFMKLGNAVRMYIRGIVK